MKSRKRRTIYEITGKQIVVTLFIATFALTLVFFIGVYVGKNVVFKTSIGEQASITSNLSDKFKETIKTTIRKNSTTAEKELDKQKAPDNVLLKKPDIFSSEVVSYRNPEQKVTTTDNITFEKNMSEKKINRDSTVDQRKEGSQKTKVKEKKYTVKVGTFTTYENAKKLYDSLKSSGYSPQIKAETTTENDFYHIVVGEFDSIEKAKEYGNSIRDKLEYINDYVIKEVIR